VSNLEEIERAVERLPKDEFAELAAWIDDFRAVVESPASGTDWFGVYMACPHPFEIPPRKKQFYDPVR
jgi:hypothetical protein